MYFCPGPDRRPEHPIILPYMKRYFFLFLLLIASNAYGQFSRFLVMDVTGNVYAGQKALAYDNAGYGAGLQASFPGYSRWEVAVSAHTGHFFGDKVYQIPDEGRVNEGPAIYSLFAGPQYFVLNRLAVSVAAGPSWYSVHTKGFSTGTGYQVGAAGFLGRKRRFILRLHFTEIPREVVNIQYLGLGIGYRFL